MLVKWFVKEEGRDKGGIRPGDGGYALGEADDVWFLEA